MKKIILIPIFFVLTTNPFTAFADDADGKLVAAFLAKEKIDRESVTILDTSWDESCSTSIVDDPSNTKLSFHLSVKKRITYRGSVFNPQTRLTFCHYNLIQVDPVNDRTRHEIEVQGFTCADAYSLTKSGNLCSCRLSKNTNIEGVLIPKDANITLSKGKITTVAIKAKEYGATPPITYYKIKKKKLVPIREEDVKSCNYEE